MRRTKGVSVLRALLLENPNRTSSSRIPSCVPHQKKPHFFVIADVEAFAKAMETETKSDQDGDSKDKKDEDEDMSLD